MEIVCLCRIGFEKEVAAEIQKRAAELDVTGYVKAKDNTGFAVFVCAIEEDANTLLEKIPFRDLIFIRHWFCSYGRVALPNKDDRVQDILNSLPERFRASSEIEALCLDTNEGKALQSLTKGVARHLQKALTPDFIRKNSAWVGQLLFLDGDNAYFGWRRKNNASPWLGGIPRLRLPKSAPSRATLKLEEAWHHFIPKEEWDTRVAPSMRAVDLGAAPGGWTWQLVQKSMFVEAVDNGPMAEALMESGQVQHHKMDGFMFSPKKAVDWLVCDIADKPARVAAMIARWGSQRWCTEAVFNLKLPMKQRFYAVEDAYDVIENALDAAEIAFELRFKQLYHDREEVTGHLRIFPYLPNSNRTKRKYS